MTEDESDERGFFAEIPIASLTKPRPDDPPPNSPAAAKTDEKPDHLGHRERLRERFSAAPDAMPDYELLELLLFRPKLRGDTKAMSKALLSRFGTFAEVLGAPQHLLQEVDGIGPVLATELKVIATAATRMVRGEIRKRDVLTYLDKVLEYCRAAMAFEEREQFRILFLNKKNALIADEVQQVGTVDHTPAYPREVVRRALELSATAVILVHNHPSGDPTPSHADIGLTREIIEAGRRLGVSVHDHLIIGKNGHVSMKGKGLI